jgi:hypothetical protein
MTVGLVKVTAAEANKKIAEVEKLAAQLGEAESQLEKGYGALAFRLKEISENRHWEFSYASFGEFLKHIQEAHKLGRAQLYRYMAVARELDGVVTEKQLTDMGISKAEELLKAHDKNPILPANAVENALDPEVTTRDLKKILFSADNEPETEDGLWLDLDCSCMVTAEEKEVILSTFNAARHGDPAVDDKLKPAAQRKLMLLKICMEYLGANSGDVVEGGRGF